MILSLLLLLFVAQSTHANGFDASRCTEEMVCYLPARCFSPILNNLVKIKAKTVEEKGGIDQCDAVIAIRAYSKKKWLIAMRQQKTKDRSAAGGLSLSINNVITLECKSGSAGQSEIIVGPGLTKGRVFSTVANDTYLMCEFEFSADQEILSQRSNVELIGLATSTEIVAGEVKPEEYCSPDLIQFHNETSEREKHEEVDAHRFTAVCPSEWQLSLRKNDSGASYEVITGLACAEHSSGPGGKKFQIITKNGSTEWLKEGADFHARCTQNRCFNCTALKCPPHVASCTPSELVEGNVSSCASLKCDGDRFEIVEEGGKAPRKISGSPTCIDGQWRANISSAVITFASCFTTERACPNITCDGCNHSASSATCTDTNHRMKVNGNSVKARELVCDRGLWKAGGAPINSTSIAISCSLHGPTVTAAFQAGMFALGIFCVIFGGGGLSIVTAIAWKYYKRGRRPTTVYSAPSAPQGEEEEKSKKTKRGKSKERREGASSGTSTSQGSKTDKSQMAQGPIEEKSLKTDSTQAAAPPVMHKSVQRPAQQHPSSEAPMEDDHGYVVIDPEQYAADQVKIKAAAAAAAAAKKAQAPPPAAASAAAAAASSEPVKTAEPIPGSRATPPTGNGTGTGGSSEPEKDAPPQPPSV